MVWMFNISTTDHDVIAKFAHFVHRPPVQDTVYTHEESASPQYIDASIFDYPFYFTFSFRITSINILNKPP
jgi:hypothetical protein